MNLTERLFARTEPLSLIAQTRLLKTLAAFVGILVIWACVATLEEQVRAQATVIASSRLQVIQVVDGGTVLDLRVHEGDIVKKGDLLAVLDPERFQASSGEVEAKVAGLRAVIERTTAEVSGRSLSFSKDLSAYPDVLASQRTLYDRRREGLAEDVGAIGRSMALAQSELSSLQKLSATGDAAIAEVLKAKRQVNELQGQMINKRNAYRQESQTDQAKAEAELAQTMEVLSQRQQALTATRLKAPMAGIVKNVRFTTKGAVLKPGDELLQIVPSDDLLIIEAKVKPADVAFLRNGLPANVKLDAYDYTIYGSLHGQVTYISPDTLEENNPRDEKPYYRVHISLKSLPKEVRRKITDIRPGMTATVEIITGHKSVMSYVLKPLRRGLSESLHER